MGPTFIHIRHRRIGEWPRMKQPQLLILTSNHFHCFTGFLAMNLGVRRLGGRVPLLPRCSKDGSPSPDNGKNDYGDETSRDWDKAWSSFRNKGKKSAMRKKAKKSLFSQFNPDKYVSWNPRRSEYPLSEEVDPIKRTERSNLMLWTSPQFTLAGAIVVVTMLIVYTLIVPLK